MRETQAAIQRDSQFLKAAEAILRAARQAQAMPPLSGEYTQLSLDDAYRIQNLLAHALQREGASFAGYKIGLTSRSAQLVSNLTEPIHGRIIRGAVHDSGTRLSAAKFIKPHVEVELAFCMGRDVAERDMSLDDIMAATEFIVPALEVVDHRMKSPRTVFDTIADNSAFAAIVLSARRFRPNDINAAWIGATLSRNGLSKNPVFPRSAWAIPALVSLGWPIGSSKKARACARAISSCPALLRGRSPFPAGTIFTLTMVRSAPSRFPSDDDGCRYQLSP